MTTSQDISNIIYTDRVAQKTAELLIAEHLVQLKLRTNYFSQDGHNYSPKSQQNVQTCIEIPKKSFFHS